MSIDRYEPGSMGQSHCKNFRIIVPRQRKSSVCGQLILVWILVLQNRADPRNRKHVYIKLGKVLLAQPLGNAAIHANSYSLVTLIIALLNRLIKRW